MLSDDVITPFCIYHYIDKQTSTYRGFIGNPTQSDGSIYTCNPPPVEYGNWYLYGTFYAISPTFKPMPKGVKFIETIKLAEFPYETSKIDVKYDPFDLSKNSINFITWTQPVPNTIPLYIFTLGSSIFPTFENKSPPNWKQSKLSPIYVLDPSKFKKTKHFAFSKLDKFQQKSLPDPNGTSFYNSFLATNVEFPSDLLETMQSLKNKKNKFSFNFSTTIIVIILLIFALLLIFSCF